MKTSRIDGFSLIEILIVLSIIAVGLTLALPSWNDARSKRELINASENLSMFLSYGRSLAIKHNSDVAASFMYQDSTSWCVGLADAGSACDCTIEDADRDSYCAVGGVPQILNADDLAQIELMSHAAEPSFVFDRVSGILASADLVNSHFFNLVSSNGKIGLQVGISVTGNTFICSWLGGANVPAYRSCEPANGKPGSSVVGGVLLTD